MMLYVWFACILFCFVSGDEFEIYCQDGVIPTEVVCTYQEPGLYRLLSLDTRVTRVILNRLTNSQVLVPDGIKQITIQSSTFDSLLPCEHVISSNSINVYIEDQDVLRHCHPATRPTREPSTHMSLEPAAGPATSATRPTREPSTHMSLEPAAGPATQPTRESGTQPNHEPTIQSSTHTILEPITQEYTEAGVTTINLTTIAAYNIQHNNSAYFSLIGVGALLIITAIAIWYKYKRQSRKHTCCKVSPVKRLPIIHHPIYKPRHVQANIETVEMIELSTDYMEPVRNTVYRPTTCNPVQIYEDISNDHAKVLKIIIPTTIIIIIVVVVIIILLLFIRRRCQRRQQHNENNIANFANVVYNGSEETIFEMSTETNFPRALVKPSYKVE